VPRQLAKRSRETEGQVHDPHAPSAEEAWVLSLIRDSGGISRPELARRTGWSRTALQTRLSTLQEQRLVQQAGAGRSEGGRRPTLLRYRKDGGAILGVQLGQRRLSVAVTNLDAEIVHKASSPIDVRDGPQIVLPAAYEFVARTLEEAQIERASIIGIGMGIPSPVAFDRGRPVYPPVMPGWHNYPLRDALTAEFRVPAFVDNDANMMAIGEQWAGLGRGVDNYIFVNVTPGIRCAPVLSGEIYRGADGCAGEIGHIPVTSENIVCQCGRTGCLEALAGAAALAAAAEEAARDGRSPELASLRTEGSPLGESDLIAAVEHGDSVALQLVRQAGVTIGEALGYVVNIYNPRLILIGGGIADRLVDLLLPTIRETVYRVSLPAATNELIIQASALGADAGLIGAAALVLRQRLGLFPTDLVRA
jgi:glucokinase-like ROK family protein